MCKIFFLIKGDKRKRLDYTMAKIYFTQGLEEECSMIHRELRIDGVRGVTVTS